MDNKLSLAEILDTLDNIVRSLNMRSRSDLSYVASDIEDINDNNQYKELIETVYSIVDGIEKLDYLVTELKKEVK